MADNVGGDYASFNGIEIINQARTTAYLQNGLKPSSMTVAADCGCPGLIDLIGCDEEYVDPTTDNAPWYSADHPESADFAGIFVTQFEGLSSTFTREATAAIGDGSQLGRGRYAGRELVWRGFLLGSSCCGVAYGLRWLTKILSDPGGCRDCQGHDMELLVCCPAVDTTDDYGGYDEGYGPLPGLNIDAFRTLKGVGLIEGPVILSERRTAGGCEGVAGGCGGSVIMEVEFTLLASNPFLFRPEVPVVNCIPFNEGVPRITTEDGEDCPPVVCGDDFFELYLTARGCEIAELPPAGVYDIGCLARPIDLETATYITVPRSLWREYEDAVPYIVIDTGAFYITDMTLGFYSSASGDPCGDLATNSPNCDLICDKLEILALPAASKLIIDGRTSKMSLVCSTNVAFPGERYTLGPFSWPVFSCYGFCMEITYSTDNEAIGSAYLGNGCVSLSIVPRSI